MKLIKKSDDFYYLICPYWANDAFYIYALREHYGSYSPKELLGKQRMPSWHEDKTIGINNLISDSRSTLYHHFCTITTLML